MEGNKKLTFGDLSAGDRVYFARTSIKDVKAEVVESCIRSLAEDNYSKYDFWGDKISESVKVTITFTNPWNSNYPLSTIRGKEVYDRTGINLTAKVDGDSNLCDIYVATTEEEAKKYLKNWLDSHVKANKDNMEKAENVISSLEKQIDRISDKKSKENLEHKIIDLVAGVDLGLDSGTIWAASPVCNEEGEYIFNTWGNVDGSRESRYTLRSEVMPITNGYKDETILLKYNDKDHALKPKEDLEEGMPLPIECRVDNKKILEPCDDVASVKLSPKWHMPTKAQIEELFSVKHEWTGEGVKFYGKNGTELFIPAGGAMTILGKYEFNGEAGAFWSSEACGNPIKAYAFVLSKNGVNIVEKNRCHRFMCIAVTNSKE